MRVTIRLFILVYVLFGFSGCSAYPSPTERPSPQATSLREPTLTPFPQAPTQTITYPPTPNPPTPTPQPSGTPDFSAPKIEILAGNLPGADDLLLGAEGSIFVSCIGDGTVRRIDPTGQVHLVVSGLSEPEGMVQPVDGTLIIVEQGKNRLVRWDPASGKTSLLLNLDNPSGKMGVDGLALDDRPGQAPSLVIPDSPNDRLLRAGLDGTDLQILATGLSRPTGAWVEANGAILVVEENGAALDRVFPDGKVVKLAANLPTPDDVIADPNGNIFVVTLGDGALHWISPTGRDQIIARGLGSPQGLAFAQDGSLLVADSTSGRVLMIKMN